MGGRRLGESLPRERKDGTLLVLCDSWVKEWISKGASERNWYLPKVKTAEPMIPAWNLTSGKDFWSWQPPSLCYVRGTRDSSRDSVVVWKKTRVIPAWLMLCFCSGSYLKCLHTLARSFCCPFCFLVPDRCLSPLSRRTVKSRLGCHFRAGDSLKEVIFSKAKLNDRDNDEMGG